jgi:hypothetical protein
LGKLFSTSGLGKYSPQFPHSLRRASWLPPSKSFLFDWQRRYVNSAPSPELSGLDFQFLPSPHYSYAQMISANNLSHLHDTLGSSRYAKQPSENSSISSPGFGQPESGHSDTTRENHGQPSLKRKVSEIESHEGMNASSKSVRRRISRACDQCNQLRTKVFGNPMGDLGNATIH